MKKLIWKRIMQHLIYPTRCIRASLPIFPEQLGLLIFYPLKIYGDMVSRILCQLNIWSTRFRHLTQRMSGLIEKCIIIKSGLKCLLKFSRTEEGSGFEIPSTT